ncbi:MAG: hypothetical protein H6551_08580 [Chitinophagales bacterium]|nr:hypothetical protein [Chitinophagaceae bacterium]MCB9065176.1 hypothetical protein [Chitinophagales bacterium]
MLKKTVIYALIIFGIGVLYISTSRDVMWRISQERNETDAWWGAHDVNHLGDMVNLAYLDDIKQFHSSRDYAFHKPEYNGSSNVNLYMNGDSYTFKIPDTAFAGVNRYEYVWIYSKHIKYNLDTTKKNILILENAERYVRIFFGGLDLFKIVYDSAKGPHQASIAKFPKVYYASFPFPDSIGAFFNPNINQNIEYNLFNYNFLNGIRIAKASFNYKVFNRASGNVQISEDGKQLFLKETIDSKRQESSYSPVSDEELTNIINNLNTIYDHYRAEGFDELYLAMIPNPVTIINPEGYNQLIPRLQNDPRLKIKLIDIYSTYQNADTVLYRPGDSHWYNSGMQLWIKEVNKMLVKWNDTTEVN